MNRILRRWANYLPIDQLVAVQDAVMHLASHIGHGHFGIF